MSQNADVDAQVSKQHNLMPDAHQCGSSAADGIARNAQGLFRFFLIRCGSDQDMAEELMQELCLQASRTPVPQADDRQRTDAWLFGIAKNVLRRHWRTITRRRRNIPTVDSELAGRIAEAVDSSPLPHETLHRKEVQQQVMLAVTSLCQMDQDVLLKYYFDGKSQNEIALEMQLSPRAVEGRLYRARQMLKDKLAHLE